MDKLKDNISVITKADCFYCSAIKYHLNKKHSTYISYDVTDFEDQELKEIVDKHNIKSYPAIFIRGKYIGGYDDYIATYK